MKDKHHMKTWCECGQVKDDRAKRCWECHMKREVKTIEKKRYSYKCTRCGIQKETNQPYQKYCSNECRRFVSNPLAKIVLRRNMGAYSELAVILDLFKRGYEVYRAVSGHCSGDIIAEKNNNLTKIDATTGRVNSNGTYGHPPKPKDVIAGVYLADQGRVVYLQDKKERQL